MILILMISRVPHFRQDDIMRSFCLCATHVIDLARSAGGEADASCDMWNFKPQKCNHKINRLEFPFVRNK